MLSRLESARQPSDVKSVFAQADEEVIQQAWALLNPAQRGALLLTRAFRGSSILLDDPDDDESPDPTDPAGACLEVD